MPSSIIAVLKNDHREVKGLLKNACSTTAAAREKRTKLFATINEALTVHMSFEERYIYSELEKRKSTKPDALEATEEHAQVKYWLKEIGSCDVGDERWVAKVTVLLEGIEHHVHEEEESGGLFDALQKLLTADQLTALADLYADMKDKGAGKPVGALASD
jgi:hemerythrin superfamily protein